MKRLAMVLAALAMCAGAAGAETQTQWNQSSRGVQQAKWVGGAKLADSTGGLNTYDTDDNLRIVEANPLNTKRDMTIDAYYDTLSINGRSLDSTSTVFNCTDYGTVLLGAKIEGHHGAAGNAVRIGVTAIFSMTPLASDTSSAFVFGHTPAAMASDSTGTAGLTAQILNGRNEQELVFLTHSAVSINTAAYRTGTLVWKNPGYKYVRFLFRVISDLATAPTQGARFKLRTSVGLRAI